MRSAAVVVFMLALAGCSKKSDKPAQQQSAGVDAGAQGGVFGGGSLGNGTATDMPGDASAPKNGLDPATMTSGGAGHTFGQ